MNKIAILAMTLMLGAYANAKTTTKDDGKVCNADIKQHCMNSKTDLEKHECLTRFTADLTPACAAHVAKNSGGKAGDAHDHDTTNTPSSN